MIAEITLWLRRRRQQRLVHETLQLEELMRQARSYARSNGFIGSVLTYQRRRGYVTPKQHGLLKIAVRRAYLTSHGA